MSKLIVGNWKLNPESASEAEALASAVDRRGTVVCPPFLYLATLKKALKRAKLGSQDAFWLNSGAYTGEVSPSQLKSLGVKYVIVGHSERRRFLLESDEMINRKVEAVLHLKLNAILCIGEDLETHGRGGGAALAYIKEQLRRDLDNIDVKYLKNLIVAYEPVWAISTFQTGLRDTPENAQKTIEQIKDFLAKRYRLSQSVVLYGGSVNAANASGYLSQASIDGVLVGAASLKPNEFNKIGI
ncbi:MAG: triose-phosphate isomerase [Candidatus Colwellbacteria bacterium]|nr:triose-phosphate isomerase [Candidatus Colwellbacteria bacterium]